jgi:leader peptidase (prepilin peptidase) / N-methyltransferase
MVFGEDPIWLGLFGLLGLLVGSFLNVVIYRLPLMLERQWATLEDDANGTEVPPAESYNLITPGSACPSCQTPLRWWNNIPLASFVLQKGRCERCGVGISYQYPLVELSTAMLFAACAWQYGYGVTALAWSGFCAILVAAAVIDSQTMLLPDDLTLPLMWAGLLCAALGWVDISLHQSVWGAAVGYLSLWTVSGLYQLMRGKVGMGGGDFKLLAAMGAWFGPVSLIALLLVSCVVGAVIGLSLRATGKLQANQYIPFGPYLSLAGVVLCFFKAPVLLFFGLAA